MFRFLIQTAPILPFVYIGNWYCLSSLSISSLRIRQLRLLSSFSVMCSLFSVLLSFIHFVLHINSRTIVMLANNSRAPCHSVASDSMLPVTSIRIRIDHSTIHKNKIEEKERERGRETTFEMRRHCSWYWNDSKNIK